MPPYDQNGFTSVTYNSPEFSRKLSILKFKSYSLKNLTFYPSFGQGPDL
jgi:hypothetical protein